ncbi:DNA-binding response regulator [Paenibacillus lycopersici]|uniref:DNA-binding response regulator n=1 Tax=Paenibacillus lycopersici TaxID=2704462 RepID=A0A6C0FZ56_9BACL|nr:DNA-binding response regulator [Paenibacillus lycopersici]QHT62386.1 DNA-binding response regulator [Paenibacillus lycopersici]
MANSSDERKRRLTERDQAEKKLLANVWWPAVGHLDHLHPEYELTDMKGGKRFADFAYMPPLPLRLILEIDGFGPHWRDISRWKFADDLQRQNHLLIQGWHLLRFAYDDIDEKPRRCQQTLLMGLAKWGGMVGTEQQSLDVYERALLHLMQERWVELAPIEAENALGINWRTIARSLAALEEKGHIHAVPSPSGRRMRYRLQVKDLSEFV